MTWSCDHCGRVHRAPSELAECDKEWARRERRFLYWVLACLFAIVAVVIGIGLLWNQYAYGDWKCLFAKCVKVVR